MKNKELINFKDTSIKNFKNSLNAITTKKAYNQKEIITKSIFGNYSERICEPDSNLLKQMEKIVICEYGNYDINWPAVQKLITDLETEIKEKTLAVYEDSLTSSKNSYLNIINTMENEFEQKTLELEMKAQESQAEIAQMKERAQLIIRKRKELIDDHRLIPSLERVNLENLRYKFELLSKQSKTLEEKLELANNHNNELENSLEIIENNHKEIIKQLEVMIAKWEIEAIELGLANAKITGLELREKHTEQIKENYRNLYITEAYNVTKLAETILKLKQLADETEIEFNDNIHELKNEVNKTTISLELNTEELERIKRANFISKTKLYSILMLDSLRNFSPNFINNYITYTETLLLASEINNTSSKIAWTTLAIFFIFSLGLGIIKVMKTLKRFFFYLVKTLREKKDEEISN